MNPQQVIEFARALFNVPDLVILAVVLLNIILGLKRGVLASVARSGRGAASRWQAHTSSRVSWRLPPRNG